MAGVLTDAIAQVRLMAYDPSASASFTDDNILQYLRESFREVVQDVIGTSQSQPLARFNVTLDKDVREYALPPHLGTILEVSKLDANELREWEIIPRHRRSPSGAGFTVEGPLLRIDPKQTFYDGQTVQITYIPSGDTHPHEGTGTFVATDDGSVVTAVTKIIFAASPTLGTLDTRLQAYQGYTVRILTAAGDWGAAGAITEPIIQERLITSYDHTTRTATFAPSLSPLPGYTATVLDNSGACTYEVLPLFERSAMRAVILKTVRLILTVVGDSARASALNGEYQKAIQALRSRTSHVQGRNPRSIPRTFNRG